MAFSTKSGRSGFDAQVEVFSIVAVGPTVESTTPHRRDVVRHEIASKLVALVHRHPQLAVRLPRQADRISQTRGEDAMTAGYGIDFPNGRASFLLADSVLAGIAVGADGDVQLRSVGARDDVLRPMMIYRPPGSPVTLSRQR